MEIKLQKKFAKYLAPAVAVVAILAAALIVTITFSSMPPTRSVLIAARSLSEGQHLNPGDVREVKLPLGDLAGNYLSEIQESVVLNRSVAKGELITRSSATKEVDLRTPIRLNNLRPISKSISVGDRVDIWATAQTQTAGAAPEPVALNAIVTLIEANNSMTQSSTNIEIRIGLEYLETLLNATDSNFQLSVILHETLADIG